MLTNHISYLEDIGALRSMMTLMFKTKAPEFKLTTFSTYEDFIASEKEFDFYIFDNDFKGPVYGEELITDPKYQDKAVLFTASYSTDLDGPFPIVAKNEIDWFDLIKKVIYR